MKKAIDPPEDIARVLFYDPVARGGQPLFQSAMLLAEWIVANDANFRDRKPKNVATFIHQIARGERTAPNTLQVAIASAIRKAAGVHAETVIARFEAVLAERTSKSVCRAHTLARTPLELWTALLAHVGICRTLVAVASDHFLYTRHPAGEELYDALVSRIGLGRNPLPVPDDLRWTFCVPSSAQAWMLWRSFYQTAALADRTTDAAETLRGLHERGQLRVRVVPPIMTGIPVVACDVEDDASRAVFIPVLHMEPHASVSVARLDAYAAGDWISRVFAPILRDAETTEGDVPFSLRSLE